MQRRKYNKTFITVVLFLLFTSCSSPHVEKSKKFDLTSDERIWLEQFMGYFMLQETAIYTLIGSKPITEIPLFYYDLPEEQQTNEDLWDKWEKIQHRFPFKKRFLLVKKERPKDGWREIWPTCRAIHDILFVDVIKAAFVIQENYELFKYAVGYDFDPLEVVFELENEDSNFWNKINGDDAWKYSHLWGLLYGFGKENSFAYLWKGRHLKGLCRNEKEKTLSASLKTWSSRKDRLLIIDHDAISISNFSIPAFISFAETDPVVTKYEAEREKIKQLYKGQDFVTFTLELLTEN